LSETISALLPIVIVVADNVLVPFPETPASVPVTLTLPLITTSISLVVLSLSLSFSQKIVTP
jgi:hypothetical protein